MHERERIDMRRKAIAAAWITGATIPLMLAGAFLVGCCVLPFHDLMHKLMPLCDMAASVLRAGHSDAGDEHDAAPAREKQGPVKPLATDRPSTFRFGAVEPIVLGATPRSTTSYRSFISLGAVRCDQDVGLTVLDQTFLI